MAMFEDMKSTHANWIALIPEATIKRKTLELLPDSQNDCWGETTEATIESIRLARKAGLKIFIKPHIVLETKEKAQISRKEDKLRGAKWRGQLKLKKEENWLVLEENYSKYILNLAAIADEHNVELFSVGTELKKFVSHRKEFWKELIREVRNVYSGKITYSANWDEFHKVKFWNELDYIGVDTYFPISAEHTPDVDKTLKKWSPIKRKLKKISEESNRQIILTEFGYRNIPFAGKQPWIHDRGEPITSNEMAQVNLYESFFRAFWKESWIAGGFAWKWFAKPLKKGNTDFTIQDKPALSVVQKWYSM